MGGDRRDFLRLLSSLPLASAALVTGCKSGDEALPADPLGVSPPAVKNDAVAVEAEAPVVYSTPEDLQRMRKVEGYGAGLPEDPQCPVTGPDVLGPFHRAGAPHRQTIAGTDEPGERIRVSGTVLLHDCKTPIKGAVLDVWHADAEGRYDNDSTDFRLRGQVKTDEEGRYAFETIKPGLYPLGATMRPAHIHFNVSYPGCHPLTTQLYFKGDRYLSPNDPCGVCSSGDQTLVVAFEKEGEGQAALLSGTFDIILAKG